MKEIFKELITNTKKKTWVQYLQDDMIEEKEQVKKGLEFAKLIRRYTDGRVLFENGHFLDAFNHIVHSLHHLARLEVIEQGFYPEATVWNQVKLIEPEIYKLYKEFYKFIPVLLKISCFHDSISLCIFLTSSESKTSYFCL